MLIETYQPFVIYRTLIFLDTIYKKTIHFVCIVFYAILKRIKVYRFLT